MGFVFSIFVRIVMGNDFSERMRRHRLRLVAVLLFVIRSVLSQNADAGSNSAQFVRPNLFVEFLSTTLKGFPFFLQGNRSQMNSRVQIN